MLKFWMHNNLRPFLAFVVSNWKEIMSTCQLQFLKNNWENFFSMARNSGHGLDHNNMR